MTDKELRERAERAEAGVERQRRHRKWAIREARGAFSAALEWEWRAEQAEVLLKDRCADLDYEYNERLKAEAERDRLLRQKQAWQDAGEAMRVRAEKAEIDLAKMTANAEIERLGREEAAKAYEKAEAERDKLKGALDISEHRGLAYMEQRDKLAARVKELESAARAALEVLIVMYQHRPPTSIGAKVVSKLRAALHPTKEEK